MNGTRAEVRDLASAHLEVVRAKLADLARLEVILADTVDRCSGTPAPVCPVLDMLGPQRGKKSAGFESP